MTFRIFARPLAVVLATTLTALIAACSSAPAGDVGQETNEALYKPTPRPTCVIPVENGTRARCPVPFESWQCTDEGIGGSPLCSCQPLPGNPRRSTPPPEGDIADTCGGAVDRPAGLEACTEGMAINRVFAWLCPNSVVTSLPSGISVARDQTFISNCVGNVDDSLGYKFVVKDHLSPWNLPASCGVDPGNCGSTCVCRGPCPGGSSTGS